MNKPKLILRNLISSTILSTILSTPSWSTTLPKDFKAETKFLFKSHISSVGYYKVEVQDGRVFVNGRKLSRSEVLLNRKALALVLHTQDAPIQSICAAGSFTHEVKRPTKKDVEKGCLDHPRFGQLLTSFNELAHMETPFED